MQTTIRPTLSFSEPEVIEAGFFLGRPVLDVYLSGEYTGCLFRSFRNAGRRLEETYQFHRKGGKPQGPKFDTLEELVLWTQKTLMKEAE